MEETEEKSDSSSESESGSNDSPVPEPSSQSKAEDTEGTSTSCSGKRKSKESCSPSMKNKKKGTPSKDGRSLSLSMPGPSTSKAKWSSSSSSEREECPVCRKQLGRKPIAVPDCCNHSFCYECISAWVTKAKSNCPMDRKDIKHLKVYDKGKLITTEAVEPKVPEEEEVGPEDEGEICPDCGWIGIRPSIGVCLHCMFHHDHPWPVEDCPQCMEAESNASDEEWEPATTSRVRRRVPSESSAMEMASSEDESAIFTSESEGDDEDEEEENISENEEAEQKAPVATTSVRRAPVRRKTKRRVVKKKRRKTTTKRKTTVRRKTSTQRKRKTKQRTTATATKRKRKTKSTARRTRKKRKLSIKTRRKQARRRIAPSDSAKARLAKLLGLRPPKDPRQLIPRGCKPRPVTSAQMAAASASTSSIVASRPVGSIDYHHRPVPTFHLFGGDELEYFPSDSDSERGGGDGGVIATRQMHSLPSEIRAARRLSRQKGISITTPRSTPSVSFTHIEPSEPVDILGSILESQMLMRSRFDIRQDGSISINATKSGLQPAAQSPRLNLGRADNLASQRPSSPSSNDHKTTSTVPDNVSTSSSVQINNDRTEEVCQDLSVSASISNQNPNESSYQEQSVVNCNNSPSSGGSKHKTSPTSQDDDEEIDIYSDIPSSEIPRDEEPSPPASPKLPQSPAIDAEQFDTSMASFATNESEREDDQEEEEEEGNERMIIDETDAAIQSPPTVATVSQEETCQEENKEETSQLSQAHNMQQEQQQQTTSAMERSPCYGGDSSTLYGSSSPCYGGGSPKYTAADAVETQRNYQDELYSGLPTPAEVCPNLFTYSAASMELARNCGVEEEEAAPVASSEVSPIGSPVFPKVTETNKNDTENNLSNNLVGRTVNSNGVPKRKSIEKTNRRQSLVEEIFGSDSEGEGPTNNDAFAPPAVPNINHPTSIQMTGLEGLDTETISETEEEANFNDPEDDTERLNSIGVPPRYSSTLKPTSSGKTEADYEEGEIVEDRPRNYTEAADMFVSVQTNETLASVVAITTVPTSPVSPDPCMIDNLDAFENNIPRSPIAINEQPPSRPLSDNRKRDKSPERRRGRESRSKKSSKKSDGDKLNSNIEWKKLSKSTKERNYRDGKAKENVSYERSEKKEKSSREDRRSKKKKEKRKDLERYDVRKVINERTRREAERRRRDKFGRDISRERSHSQSPSHSPHNPQHHQPRNRRRTPEADYQSARNRGRHYRNDSWSSNHSNHSRYSMSGSSRASSPRSTNRVGHHSSSRHRHNHREEEKNRELSGERHRARGRSVSRSPSRSHSREMARRNRRDPSIPYTQPTPGMVTIVSGHERLTSQGMKNSHVHQMPSSQLNDSVITASMLSAVNAANKKKPDKSKDKKKKDGKKKKKEHHRHVLAPLAPAGSVTNNNPPAGGVNVSSVAIAEKKKRKREKSPPASKEVFASGDNILVSVNFNKPPMPLLSTAATSLASIPKSKELASNNLQSANNMPTSIQKRIIKDNQQVMRSDGHGRPAPKRLKRDMGRKVPEHGNIACDRSPRRKSNDPSRSSLLEKQQAPPQQVPNRKRDDGMKRRKRIAEIAAKRKPVAIIDLESSPFAERAPSPAVVITLSDNETRLSSSSRSSRRSSSDDNRRGRRRMDKEEQRPRKQRKLSKSDMKAMDRQMPMTAPTLNTAPTVALGPKTPPEPQIKFSINAKPQLRSITNPLQDEDDDAEIDVVTVTGANRDKSEIDLSAVVNAGVVSSNSGIPTLLVSSHNMPTLFRGPNTPPEPCLTQSRSSSCSTTTKLDNDTSKGDAHIPQSPVDAKSPDVYDPFEPTKSPSSDASSLERAPDISQLITDDLLEEVNDSIGNEAALTPGSISDNSENSSRLIPQVPESPTPENIVDHPKHQTLHEEDISRKDEAILNKTENVVPSSIRPHHNISQVEDQQTRSPAQAVSAVSAAETADTTEMKPSSTTTIILPPPVAGAQELFTTLPPNVASILCAQQHQGLFRPPLNAAIATVPILLSAPSLLGLRVSQHAILAANQQPLVAQQHAQHAQQHAQQQQPDTTTTTDVVDMDLESPYSPASSEGDDLFEPPDKPPSPTYLPRNEKKNAKANSRLSHQKRNTTDKFDALFNQSTPLKKEASSTSGNRGTRGKGTHGHRSTKGRHNRADKSDNKSSKVGSTQKSRSKNANSNEKSKNKKEISIKMDEDQLKILDDLPSSAVEMQVKEKFLKKLNRQERVVEEVKLALKPHYTKKLVNKEEYKEILRRSVPKICHNKTGEINPIRIRFLVGEYVKKFRYLKKKDSTRSRGKADKQRKNN